jgi:hypothetical protein
MTSAGFAGTPSSCKYFKIPLAVLSSIVFGTDNDVFIPPIKSRALSIAVGILLSLKLTT